MQKVLLISLFLKFLDLKLLIKENHYNGSNKRKRLTVSGKTEDGNLVLKNIFVLFDSRGVPLEIILQKCKEQSFIVDWIDFIDYTIRHKRSIETTLRQVYDALVDVYDSNYADEVLKRLKLYLTFRFDYDLI